jgi:ankyrin repeat protein
MNKDILKALAGGLPEDTIISNINNNKSGFNINTINPKTGETVLHTALLLNKPKVVLCLLNKNVSLRMNTLKGNHTNVYLKKSPIKDKSAINKKFDQVLKSNIHQAILGNLLGSPHIMDRIDSNTAGFNINSRGENGQTPIQAALYYGRPGVVKALLARNADISIKDAKGRDVMWYAQNTIDPKIKGELLHMIQMQIDAMEGNISKALVGGLSEVNIIRNINNNKPGFNINTINTKTGETTLQSALLLGRAKVALCLLDKNVSLRMNALTGNQTNVYLKKSPITGADKKAIISKFDQVLKSDIHQAILGNLLGTPHITDRIDSNTAGFNINSRGEHGQTPIQAALYYGRPGVVKALLARNADISIRDAQGKDVMWYAQNTIDPKIKGELVNIIQKQIDHEARVAEEARVVEESRLAEQSRIEAARAQAIRQHEEMQIRVREELAIREEAARVELALLEAEQVRQEAEAAIARDTEAREQADRARIETATVTSSPLSPYAQQGTSTAIANSTTVHRRVLRNNPSDSFSINATYGSMGNQDVIYQINYQTPRGKVVQEMGRMYWAGIASTQSNYNIVRIGQDNVPRQTSFVGRVATGVLNFFISPAGASDKELEVGSFITKFEKEPSLLGSTLSYLEQIHTIQSSTWKDFQMRNCTFNWDTVYLSACDAIAKQAPWDMFTYGRPIISVDTAVTGIAGATKGALTEWNDSNLCRDLKSDDLIIRYNALRIKGEKEAEIAKSRRIVSTTNHLTKEYCGGMSAMLRIGSEVEGSAQDGAIIGVTRGFLVSAPTLNPVIIATTTIGTGFVGAMSGACVGAAIGVVKEISIQKQCKNTYSTPQ